MRTDELYLSHVVSERSHARIVSVDPTDALAMDGVVDYISHDDVPASNNYDLLYTLTGGEETVFAKDTVSDYTIIRRSRGIRKGLLHPSV